MLFVLVYRLMADMGAKNYANVVCTVWFDDEMIGDR